MRARENVRRSVRTRVPRLPAIRDWRVLERLHMTHLVSDSREVTPGDTFVAYPGETRDGRDFIPQAISRGAASVLWEKRDFNWPPEWNARKRPSSLMSGPKLSAFAGLPSGSADSIVSWLVLISKT